MADRKTRWVTIRDPTSDNNKVAACVRYARSGEHGSESHGGNFSTLAVIPLLNPDSFGSGYWSALFLLPIA